MKKSASRNTTPEVAKLTEIAQAVGGPAYEAFKELLTKALKYDELANYFVSDLPAVSHRAPMAAAEPEPPHYGRYKSFDTLDDGKRLDLQVRLVHAKAKGQEVYNSLFSSLKKDYGPNSGKHLRAFFARTQGKFRSVFLQRLIQMYDDKDQPQILADLANAYSKIEGKNVTAEQLKRETQTKS